MVTLPDGRAIRLEHEGPLGDWIASLDEPDRRSARGRWLLIVLSELLDLAPGRKPEWVLDIIRDVTGRDTAAGHRYPCACCDFFTLTEPPTGTFAICPVCGWEDDNLQFVQPDRSGGANHVSLRQARENFRELGVSELRGGKRARARPPRPEERAAPLDGSQRDR
jgi:cysteine-rich CPCC protein